MLENNDPFPSQKNKPSRGISNQSEDKVPVKRIQCTQEFKETVVFSGVELRLSCSDSFLLRRAKEILEDHCRGKSEEPLLKQLSKDRLLSLSSSSLCRTPPEEWKEAVRRLQSSLLRNVMRSDFVWVDSSSSDLSFDGTV